MNAYVDASVLMRVVLGQPDTLEAWSEITEPISSELIRVECRRAVDRLRLRDELDEDQIVTTLVELRARLDRFDLADLDAPVLERAAEPFPTMLATLDALHLATALIAREEREDFVFATHDDELARGARAMGFDVYGV